MTTAIIILSAILLASVSANFIAAASKRNLLDKMQRLSNKLRRYREHVQKETPVYYATPSVGENSTHIWFVCRYTAHDNGVGINSVIKTFDTSDAEYNRNEAEELVENLTKTLCYD